VKGSSWHALPDMIVILDLFGGLAFHLGRFGLHFFFWLSWRTGEHYWRHLPLCGLLKLTQHSKCAVMVPFGQQLGQWTVTVIEAWFRCRKIG
jgi:hypothetical protein